MDKYLKNCILLHLSVSHKAEGFSFILSVMSVLNLLTPLVQSSAGHDVSSSDGGCGSNGLVQPLVQESAR